MSTHFLGKCMLPNYVCFFFWAVSTLSYDDHDDFENTSFRYGYGYGYDDNDDYDDDGDDGDDEDAGTEEDVEEQKDLDEIRFEEISIDRIDSTRNNEDEIIESSTYVHDKIEEGTEDEYDTDDDVDSDSDVIFFRREW